MNTVHLIDDTKKGRGEKRRKSYGIDNWAKNLRKAKNKIKSNFILSKKSSSAPKISLKLHNKLFTFDPKIEENGEIGNFPSSKVDFSENKGSFMMFPKYSKSKRKGSKKEITSSLSLKYKSQRPMSVSFAPSTVKSSKMSYKDKSLYMP